MSAVRESFPGIVIFQLSLLNAEVSQPTPDRENMDAGQMRGRQMCDCELYSRNGDRLSDRNPKGISLRRHPADFLAFSFYKIFGLPTGLGALIVKREAMARLRRPWFSGGTVDFVSILHDRHQLSSGHAAFEDGTPDFLSIGAVTTGFDFISRFRSHALQRRLEALTERFIDGMHSLKRDGASVVRIYGPASMQTRGSTIAFNIVRSDGSPLPYQQVEEAARERGIAIRGGCFCNPGAAEQAFEFARHDIGRCLDELGRDFTIPRMQKHLGPRVAVGALRASIGAPTTERDIDRAIELASSFA